MISRLIALCMVVGGPLGLMLMGSVSANEMEHAVAQIEWLEKRGGYFNPKLSFAPLGSLPSAAKGVFTTEDIKQGETLLVLPQSAILGSGKESFERDHDFCETARNLLRQYRLGEKSEYWPYVNHVFSNNIRGRLPSQWSDEGKELLKFIKTDDLKPWKPTGVSYRGRCKDDDYEDPLIEDAYFITLSRSWDDKLLPVYDMMSHRNGNWTNVDSNSAHRGKDIVVFAVRDVKAGEQMYLSYNECSDCENYAYTYGLPDLVKDYGFVEQYPQRWIFPGPGKPMVFDLDVKDGLDGKPELYVTWRRNSKPKKKRKEEKIEFLEVHLDRLDMIKDKVYEEAMKLRDHERSVNLEFYETMKTALKYGIADSRGEPIKQVVCMEPTCEVQ
uniref:SET domain-containing protein n=2 Tax=Grammatophora oceanica TaxID=210454 RepID=A0A7S1VGT3_9STRA|mmetsp:Transcript_46103/g.68683  ORF Transcript_46103/g.68683 Transcript_46103/m.68683 type:complete len:385 (+) Transcript_46103:123-1277(+)|eukprot:CAMPEP_0194033168 /NCGR_PEP_ID=MMETSP0009_2-20130614/5951_1 /TAXON_ID=210454 /ORGANISM="Grammatophora oceanica, Strain CCMP 410" /LENGTH=384 /DNA_ID=CAMNT_0038673809 /DNA_START=104 /DNA_END=1258 /DNA_ORIENTATION=-